MSDKCEQYKSHKILAKDWGRFVIDVGLAFGIAFLLSWWLASGDRELAWQHACFDPVAGEWTRGEGAFWRFLYEFASLPVVLTCGVAIVVLVLGLRWPKWRAWRRISWFAIALILLGSGIIANLWLKETWGRPRPRETLPFGGREPYEPIFGMDLVGLGKSFPCGHATVGFYFLGLYFLLRGRHPRWAWGALLFSLGWGGLIGYTRMLQGGHFATDVVWAAAVMWISAAFLVRILGLDRRLFDVPLDGSLRRTIPWPAKLAGGLAIAALLVIVAMATPYRAKREIVPHEVSSRTADAKGSIRIELGDVEIHPAEQFSIRGEAWGHGLPTSQITSRWEEETEADGIWRFKYFQRYSGKFTEIRQDLEIGIPWERMEFLKLDLGPGRVALHLPSTEEVVKIELVIREATVELVLEPDVRVSFEAGGPPFSLVDETGGEAQLAPDAEVPRYHFVPTEAEGGSIVIRKPAE